jgi:ABC-type multidrug transport system fused ATPase/permease subunit
VDSETEKVIQRALNIVREGRTTLIIAHRLSTIRDADVIFFVKEGQIAESGSHRELMALEGLYHHLYRSQYEEELGKVGIY